MEALEDVLLPSSGPNLPLLLLLLLATCLAALLLGSLLLLPYSSSQKPEKSVQPESKSPQRLEEYSKEEVAEHRSRDDCWLIIKGQVYNVTKYVELHPGGDAILNNAGGDATDGFYGALHPSSAFTILHDFLIGTVSP